MCIRNPFRAGWPHQRILWALCSDRHKNGRPRVRASCLRAPFLLSVLLLAGCRGTPPEAVRATWVKRDGAAVCIQLSRPVDLNRVESLGLDGRAAQAWTFTPGPRQNLRLEPAPAPGRQRLRLQGTDRQTFLIEVDVLPAVEKGLRLRLALPLGIPDTGREVWVPVCAPATLSLLIEREETVPLAADVRLLFSPGLEVRDAGPSGWTETADGDCRVLVRAAQLRDREEFLLNVAVPAPGRTCTVTARITPVNASPMEAQARVRGASMDEVRRLVHLSDTRLPTNRFGEFDATRRTDVLQLPTRFGRWLRESVGGLPMSLSGEEPFCFQSARVANDSDTTLAVEVRAWVCAAEGSEPCLDFGPPIVLGKATAEVATPALIPPRSETSIVLPVFVRPEALQGDYRRMLEVRMLGTDAVLTSRAVSLRVEQTDRPAFFIAMLAVLITLLTVPVLAWRGPALLRRFAPVELIQIALFGSAAFLLVGVPTRLFATILNAIAPVVSPFILGLYSHVVALGILGALVVLIPRPGVVLLAGTTRFLLNGVFFGAFSPVDFLYAIPVLLAGEICLWIFGVTRSRNREVSAVQLAPACALMGVVAAGLQLSLEMSLYRLFFADWYVFLFLVLDGALYPALGAVLGARLGTVLKRTAE